MRVRTGLRRVLAGLVAASIAVVPAIVGLSSPAAAQSPVTGAAFTSVNETVDDAGHCANGNPNNNCNIYDGKQYVWLNGGPATAYVGDGDYFFAVLSPGGQADPNDGADNNLSDLDPSSGTGAGDDYTNRTFTVANGLVSYGGSHDFDPNKIRLIGYDDTTNPGGVYILAVCSLADGYPVNASDCKYDAFKVNDGDVVTPPASAPTIVKDADGSDTKTYAWTISKGVDKTRVEQVGGNATFNYTVTAAHDAGTISDVTVTGTISVFNSNVDASHATVPIDIDGVSDQLSDGTVCAVTGGGPQTLTAFQTDFAYSCDLSALPQGDLDNTATVAWSDQFLTTGALLDAGETPFTFTRIAFAEDSIDECVHVTDTFGLSGQVGSTLVLGDLCVDGSSTNVPATVTAAYASPSWTLTYARTVAVPQYDCKSYDNTARFTTNDTGATGSASATITVCGPAKTGALTIGFWQNKNGQGIITGQAKTGVCPSATWLRAYAPFQDLSATATCAQVGTYVTNVIKAASSAGSTMNPMLKAQMLATALDVYFSDPALGGNKISAPAPIGGVAIDLTKVCKMIDGSGGVATCAGSYQNVSGAFGGATSLTVSQMLAYAASQSNAGGTSWYGQVKATQELAKNAFDAINNQVAFKAV